MIFENYYLVIWGAAFFTAIVSATIGMMGGTVLIAILAQYLKLEVLIPVHGIIQLSSNGTRAWFIREAINWRISFQFIVGVLIGSVCGSIYVMRVNEAYYNIVLGLFILAITLVPKFKTPMHFKGKWSVLGFVASFIGLFMGAVGVLVGSVFLADKIEKREMISTQATCQTVLHLAKVLVFVSLGFAIGPWLSLLAGALLMTYFGSWVGTRILDKIPEKIFRKVLTVVVAFLACRLIWQGISAF
jgi:uncharacterized protein